MNEEPRGLAGQWPLLVTCAGIVLMGVFVLTAADERFGWVFVAFGVFVIVRTALAAVRDRRG
ncbi:hypothetical protein [Aeromicrobium sp.]|uniref:hypothetical protein n=1 Tax=Aeromicrobium sp. TaxID=1871063 RepID=UPI0028AAE98D|nr:hypothetical protein [Aeromicrobium sp.]